MNPLLATSLVSLGHKLVDNLLPNPSQTSQLENAPAFSDYMHTSATSQVSELSHFLQANGVDGWEGLETMRFQFAESLKNHPELAGLRNAAGAQEQWSFEVENGEFVTVRTSAGRSVTLSADSEAGRLAMRLGQMEQMREFHQRMPGEGIVMVAETAARQPMLNSMWAL